MAQPRLVSTEQIVAECEHVLDKLGFCNYAEVGRRLHVSRQTIHKRLQAAEASGEISPETAERYKPLTGRVTQRFNSSLTPENHMFVMGIAAQLGVPPAYVLHAAVTRYRESLLEPVTPTTSPPAVAP